MFTITSLVDSFFFFQAEDGIRDADVTGVQTCALPIFTNGFRYFFRIEINLGPAQIFQNLNAVYLRRIQGPLNKQLNVGRIIYYINILVTRSEERRVGKECRSRWWT